MDASAITDMVNSLSDAASDAASTMKGVFGDESGKAAEAVAQADSEQVQWPRGNGPCGPKTKDVGGVNYNEPDEEKKEEDANKKAYYMKKFEDACNRGDMTQVEKLYKVLTEEYGESPAVLERHMAKLPQSAPQTKAGITRTNDLFTDANNKLNELGTPDKNNSFSTINSTTSEVSNTGNGTPWLYDLSKNMNKKLLGSQDEANQQAAANNFINEIRNGSLIFNMINV